MNNRTGHIRRTKFRRRYYNLDVALDIRKVNRRKKNRRGEVILKLSDWRLVNVDEKGAVFENAGQSFLIPRDKCNFDNIIELTREVVSLMRNTEERRIYETAAILADQIMFVNVKEKV